MYFDAPAEAVKELDRVLRINENVLRYMVVRREDQDSAAAQEKEAAAENVK